MDTLDGATRMAPVLVAGTVFIMTQALLVKSPLSSRLGIEGVSTVLLPAIVAVAAYIVLALTLHRIIARLPVTGGEDIFRHLQILTSCYVAMGNGANDVANAMGPLSAVYFIATTGHLSAHVPVPSWLLAFGGVMIAMGICTWGYKVIETVGSRITRLTNTRGFTVDFSAASVILIASMLGLPVSTTHAAVGAYVGIGLARGMQALDIGILWRIMLYWVVTVPVAALTSACIFLLLSAIIVGS
jgi:PiT family inorganic phosphate transporter